MIRARRSYSNYFANTGLMSFMKKSKEPARPHVDLDLEFPDSSGMDDSSNRISPEAAFRLSELYPQLFAAARKGKLEPRPKECLPEFEL